jgi:hypothetical protein
MRVITSSYRCNPQANIATYSPLILSLPHSTVETLRPIATYSPLILSSPHSTVATLRPIAIPIHPSSSHHPSVHTFSHPQANRYSSSHHLILPFPPSDQLYLSLSLIISSPHSTASTLRPVIAYSPIP